MDEKGAAKILEESTSSLPNMLCSFNVAPNAFVGLELSETTAYDLIFVAKDMPHLNASSFLRILRNVGAPMDIVAIVEATDPFTHEQAKAAGFFTILKKQYQPARLCQIIEDVMRKNEKSLGLGIDSDL